MAIYLFITHTVTGAEKSFSKLKLIKIYLKSIMLQLRRSILVLISIENKRLKKLNSLKMMQTFTVAEKRFSRDYYLLLLVKKVIWLTNNN